MKVGYVVRPRADRDIDDIADYLADEAGLNTALQFLAEIDQKFRLPAGRRSVRDFLRQLYGCVLGQREIRHAITLGAH